jgi:nucleoside-diphosphate-sugar epimerase
MPATLTAIRSSCCRSARRNKILSQTTLVTGATGFVGQGLIAHLRRLGRSIRLASREAGTGDDIVGIGDIGPDTDWSRALDGVGTVIHLAGRAHVMARERDALSHFRKVNAEGTRRLAEQAEKAGVQRFVLVSSVKAAADTTGEHALLETDPASPRTPYGVSKLEGEQALWAVARNMEPVVLRPPLVYGPGVKANFRSLLRLVDSGLPLPLGSVRNRRSVISRDNLVDAIAVAAIANGVVGKTFYVTEGPPLSTPALIRGLAKGLGRPARLIDFSPALIALLARLAGRRETADSLLGSLAVSGWSFRAATGWQPPVAQQAAFDDVAAWYLQTIGRISNV